VETPVARVSRVSRETRSLFVAVFLAVIALWTLARLRDTSPPADRSPVAPLLAPLVPRPTFDDLAQLTAEATAKAGPLLVSVVVSDGRADEGDGAPSRVAGVRLSGTASAVLLSEGMHVVQGQGLDAIARDDATGLTIIRHAQERAVAPGSVLSSREPHRLRYLLKSHAHSAGVALSPVLAGAFVDVDAPLWGAPVWEGPILTDIASGDMLFTPEGEWVGLVVTQRGSYTVVPGAIVRQLANRVMAQARQPRGTLGVELQRLSHRLQRLSGAASGAVVTGLSTGGPGEGLLAAGDVLEAADGKALPTLEHWQRYLADVSDGQSVTLRLHRSGERRDVTVVAGTAAVARHVSRQNRAPGLMLQSLTGSGSIVTLIQPGSAADRASLRLGDVITRVGAMRAPRPAQVQRAFRLTPPGQPLLVVVQREGRHLVVPFEP